MINYDFYQYPRGNNDGGKLGINVLPDHNNQRMAAKCISD